MIYSIQPKIYTKLKGSLYAIISLILISFIFFAIKYNETSNQKKEEALSKILKNNYFLELNKFIFQKVSSPYLNITHKIKKGENLTNIFKSYNIDQKDISKAKDNGNTIKLIASINKSAKVNPIEISRDDPMCVKGALNSVKFTTEFAGEEIIIGKGAGGMETASAIIRDLVEIKQNMRV